MAVGMIGGSPLRGREAERDRRSRTSGASQRATTNSLGTTSQPCASLPPWHSGFNQLSLDPSDDADAIGRHTITFQTKALSDVGVIGAPPFPVAYLV